MKSFRQKENAGYMAILTVLIACSVLSALLFSSSTRSLFMKISEGQNEDNIKSRFIADSCIYSAIAYYIQNSNYSPINQSVSLDTQTNCVIDAMQLQNNLLQIDTTGIYGKSITHMHAEAKFVGNTILPVLWTQTPS